MKKMKIMYITWGLLVVALIGALTCIGFIYQKKLKPYKDLENNLISVTEKYIELKFLYPEEGEKLKITTKELVDANLLKDFSYKNEKCEGYTLVTFNGVYNYDSYIKCDNYTTRGY